MDNDRKYNHALDAALSLMDDLDGKPCLSKYQRLALLVYAIMHAMDTWQEELMRLQREFSVN